MTSAAGTLRAKIRQRFLVSLPRPNFLSRKPTLKEHLTRSAVDGAVLQTFEENSHDEVTNDWCLRCCSVHHAGFRSKQLATGRRSHHSPNSDTMSKDKMGKDGMMKNNTTGMSNDSMKKDGMKDMSKDNKPVDGMKK